MSCDQTESNHDLLQEANGHFKNDCPPMLSSFCLIVQYLYADLNSFDSADKLIKPRENQERGKIPRSNHGPIFLVMSQISFTIFIGALEQLQNLQACLDLEETL